MERSYRLGIDVGGTFTDFILLDEEKGSILSAKATSTRPDLWPGIARGIAKIGADLASTTMVVHGTTVGLNALLERRGPKLGLITTKGFRDVYEIGRHNRVDMYDLFYRKPEPLVPREFRHEVHERVDARGQVLEALKEEEILRCIETFQKHQIRNVAVCFLHSYQNPVHEEQVGAIFSSAYPEAHVSLSHQVAREWREYERTSTTAINAYLTGVFEEYVDQVERELRALHYGHPLFVNQSSGGLMTVGAARAKPVHTLYSGPAGGTVSTAALGASLGFKNLIAFDMGGTSTDVSLIFEGEARMALEAQVERHPLLFPMIDIHSIGAGGGSIAWLDPVGALKVGPHSAGADPGPACYGRGGADPTVTDAHLLLGRLSAGSRLGGELSLDRQAAERVLSQRVAGPLGLELIEAADGIIRIINTKMAYAMRAITIQRGLDPKEFVLVPFGGAGPMHACEMMDELNIPVAVVPAYPGAYSALGLLLSDVRHDFARTYLARLEEVDAARVRGLFRELEEQARRQLDEEGVPEERFRFQRSLDMRYVGQEYTLNVPLSSNSVNAHSLRQLRPLFDELHQRNYGHSAPEEPTELVNLRIVALGVVPRVELEPIPEGGPDPPGEALAGGSHLFLREERSFVPAPVYDRAALRARNRLLGPAVITEMGATTILLPGFQASVSAQGHLIIERAHR